MTNDTGSPLALIAAILQRHGSNLQTVSPTERSAPAFDPQLLHLSHELSSPHASIAQRVSSWSLPNHVSTEVTTFLSEELSKYQTFVQSTRTEILAHLIKTTFANDPSIIPSLVESTCDAVYQSAIDNMLSRIQREVESFNLHDGDIQSDDGSDSESASEVDSEDDEGEDVPDEVEGEEDNAPMRPGEEVPPLETKYLPIFEALHERGKVLTKPEKTYLVNMTGMTYRQITIWFQNRRRGELKESMNMATSYSKASSIHSDDTSELSEQELEKSLGACPQNTTFDIRSWRLQSALATKDDSRGSIPPFSPLKCNFPSITGVSDTESDIDLSDDSDDDIAPPGLQAPSLTTSITTMDSVSTLASIANSSALQPPFATRDALSVSKEATHTRPIRSLPSSRRSSPSTSTQPTQHRYSHSLHAQNPALQHQPSGVTHSSSQYVSSNENGLTVNLDITSQLQASTLRSSPASTPLAPQNTLIPSPPSVSPSPPPTSAGSARRQLSPTLSTSPRPHIKPLPRRTGCAPRPRPPPRSGGTAPLPASVTAPGSSRSSVVLPPSSNPSLGNTTLGALLRPNPPAPTIPQEVEERLTAMAGRMGVGASSGSGARQSIPSNVPRVGVPGHSAFPGRNTQFSFGPASLPRTSVSSAAVPGQPTLGSAGLPPSS
ncbi:unnamed protein product [Rhizoctonia solani]|uniref:Homeobox domain-containing protein n=1 Tax=Rhizoctonia solani TaxID=456999 RepID=A0A8H3BT56_9AGAM|nr:unnamed protein product [Rhizoctonia solani]